jgi:hypothetical protein
VLGYERRSDGLIALFESRGGVVTSATAVDPLTAREHAEGLLALVNEG